MCDMTTENIVGAYLWRIKGGMSLGHTVEDFGWG